MLDINFIRKHPEEVKRGASAKGVDIDIDALLAADEERRKVIAAFEEKRAEQNAAGERIAAIADPAEKKAAIEEMASLKAHVKRLDEEMRAAEARFLERLRLVPNLPLPDVKAGKDDTGNEVLREVGDRPDFDFAPKDYMEIGEALGLVDTERAAKVSGARFYYLKGDAVLLEFALLHYAVGLLIPRGFRPVLPPVMVKPEVMAAMGYMDRHSEEIYALADDDLVLVGTSEQSIGPMHRDETLDASALPLRYLGFSTCFRREAGSYGKDTRGILRVHQFNKLEMFSFTAPADSEAEHLFLLDCQEAFMKGLGLPYRVVRQCTGDMGAPAARTYDLETWIPSQGRYRETHSTSTTTDFQSRRLNIGWRNPESGKRELVHMLNGTVFADTRILLAILENFQQADGSVKVPDVLVPYMGKAVIG